MSATAITLSELASIIKAAISDVALDYWITAEVSSVSVHRGSRHCYLELVEKQDDAPVAQMRATIWARDFSHIDREFRRATGRTIEAGMMLLVRARPTFHELYGLSLSITEVDPAYTLGGIELLRKKIIERLTVEGVIEQNRALAIPIVPQRIAVISSATAAGYGDFMRRINENAEGYAFIVELFPALMQGEQAERSILDALAKCRKRARRFDLLAIIRGGGSQLELQCFDSYALAREVATFPLPVLTGIGHERDETVLDRVANMRMITPTATAEFIISRTREFERTMDALSARLIKEVRAIMGTEASRLDRHTMGIVGSARSMLASRGHLLSVLTHRFRGGTVQMLGRKDSRLDRTLDGLGHLSKRMIARVDERLGRLELKVSLMDPQAVLGRGYSITYLNGRALKDSAPVRENDIITTRLFNGAITSAVVYSEREKEDGSR